MFANDSVDYYLDAKKQSFHNKRGKDFAVNALKVLFEGKDDITVQSSTHGADRTMDLSGICVQHSSNRNAVDSADDDTKTRLVKWLPFEFDPTNRQKLTSDVYVHDKNGNVLVLGEVANSSDNPEVKREQLFDQMMFCIKADQPKMFGIVFHHIGVILAKFTVSENKRNMVREYSNILRYDKDGLRKAFIKIISDNS